MSRSEAEGMPWVCAVHAQGTAGGNAPSDCNWPMCGCDPYADKVIAGLQESGYLQSEAQLDATKAYHNLLVAENAQMRSALEEIAALQAPLSTLGDRIFAVTRARSAIRTALSPSSGNDSLVVKP